MLSTERHQLATGLTLFLCVMLALVTHAAQKEIGSFSRFGSRKELILHCIHYPNMPECNGTVNRQAVNGTKSKLKATTLKAIHLPATTATSPTSTSKSASNSTSVPPTVSPVPNPGPGVNTSPKLNSTYHSTTRKTTTQSATTEKTLNLNSTEGPGRLITTVRTRNPSSSASSTRTHFTTPKGQLLPTTVPIGVTSTSTQKP